MGAWGAGSFENDDASDWLAELDGSGDWSVVEQALGKALEPGYFEAPDASVALAAAEVVAGALEAPAAGLPDEVKNWLADHAKDVTPEHAETAYKAVERVAMESELQELWADSEDPSEWQAKVIDLQKRLAGAHRTDDLLT